MQITYNIYIYVYNIYVYIYIIYDGYIKWSKEDGAKMDVY